MKLILLIAIINLVVAQEFIPQRTVTYSYMIDFNTYCNYTLMPAEYNYNDVIGIEIWSRYTEYQSYMRITKETNQRPINVHIGGCGIMVDNYGYLLCYEAEECVEYIPYVCGRIIVYFNDTPSNISSSSVNTNISYMMSTTNDYQTMNSASMDYVYINSNQSDYYESLMVDTVVTVMTIVTLVSALILIFAILTVVNGIN